MLWRDCADTHARICEKYQNLMSWTINYVYCSIYAFLIASQKDAPAIVHKLNGKPCGS